MDGRSITSFRFVRKLRRLSEKSKHQQIFIATFRHTVQTPAMFQSAFYPSEDYL